MNYVPDTNVGVYFLRNVLAAPLPIGNYFVSAITEIELFSKPGISTSEAQGIRLLLSGMSLIEIPPSVRQEAARIRIATGLKLPDAIIAATALTLGATLLSNDRQMTRVPELTVATLALRA